MILLPGLGLGNAPRPGRISDEGPVGRPVDGLRAERRMVNPRASDPFHVKGKNKGRLIKGKNLLRRGDGLKGHRE